MKKYLALLPLAFLGIVACACGHAATITGTVTDASNGNPLAGAKVVALVDSCTIVCFPQEAAVATTDASGTYSLNNLASNDYSVYTDTDAFADEDQAGNPCLIPSGCFASSPRLHLNNGSTLSGINFALAPGSRIAGHVYDGDAGPGLAGRTVWIDDGVSSLNVSTLADGQYEFRGLHGGNYRLSATDYAPLPQQRLSQYFPNVDCDDMLVPCPTSGLPYALGTSADQTGVDFHLHAGAYVHGVVTNALNGAPQGIGIRILVASDVTEYRDASTSTAAGDYYFGPLMTGEVLVEFKGGPDFLSQLYSNHPCPQSGCDYATATHVAVTTGQLVDGINAQLVPTRTVSGTVRQSGTNTPVAGIRVAAGFISSFDFTFWHWGFNPVAQALTDANGHYVLMGFNGYTNLVVRTLDATGMWADGAWQNVACTSANRQCQEENPTPAYTLTNLNAQPTPANVDLLVSAGGSITGTVSWRHDLASDVTVFLVDATSHNVAARIPVLQDGSYRIDHLLTGDYLVAAADSRLGSRDADGVVFPNTSCWFQSQATLACDLSSAQLVHVVATQITPGIDLALPLADVVYQDGFE